MKKQLWVLVGGNGAGKTTFYDERIKPLGIPFINADLIARAIYPDDPERHSYSAAKVAELMRLEQIQLGNSFCFETVFSHPSKIDFLALARAQGYQIILVMVHVESTAINKLRIIQRVAGGGHRVPDEKIDQRIPRMLVNVQTGMPLCDEVYILDNSSAEIPFRPVLTLRNGHVYEYMAPLPTWAVDIVNPGRN